MGVAGVRRRQGSSASRSGTGGLEFAGAVGTVRNCRCWRAWLPAHPGQCHKLIADRWILADDRCGGGLAREP